MDKNEPTDALENTTSCIAKLFYMKESDEWEEAYVGNCTVVKKVVSAGHFAVLFSPRVVDDWAVVYSDVRN